jgi:hypothetical protein
MLSSFVGGREIAAFRATGGNARLWACTFMAASASRKSACHLQEFKKPVLQRRKERTASLTSKKERTRETKDRIQTTETPKEIFLFCEEGFKRTADRSAKTKGGKDRGALRPLRIKKNDGFQRS